MAFSATEQEIEDLFRRADELLFREKNFIEAEQLYRQILTLDQQNIDALNAVAYCIKFSAQTVKMEPLKLFEQVHQLYIEALKIDRDDVEANFNMGLLYLQIKNDLNEALAYFEKAVKKDKQGDAQTRDLYRAQFSKAYYNIGMIYDRLSDIARASTYYKKSLDVSGEQQSQNPKSVHYMKAMTNYAVTLEKLGKRPKSVQTFQKLREDFPEEIRVHNNLGIVLKREGNFKEALESYKKALSQDSESFFPNYNMAVLLAQDKVHDDSAISYFEKALSIAKEQREQVYEINVLINMGLVEERRQDIGKAIQNLQQALGIDPQNQKIKQKLTHLEYILKKQREKLEKEGLDDQKRQSMEQRLKEKAEQEQKKKEELAEIERKKQEEQQKILDAEREQRRLKREAEEKKRKEDREKKEQEQRERKAQLTQIQEESKIGTEVSQNQAANNNREPSKNEFLEVNKSDDPKRINSEYKEVGAANELDFLSFEKQASAEVSKKQIQNQRMVDSRQTKKEGRKSNAELLKQIDEELVALPEPNVALDQQDQISPLKNGEEDAYGELEEDKKEEEDLNQSRQNSEKRLSGTFPKPDPNEIDDSPENFRNWSPMTCQKQMPNHPERALFRLGVYFLTQPDYSEAMECFGKLLRQHADFLPDEVALHMGDLLYKMGKTPEALMILEKSQALNGSNYKAPYLQGKCHDKLGAFEAATKKYEEALQLVPQSLPQDVLGNMHFRHGWALAKIKKFNDAVKYMSQGDKILKTNVELKNKLCSIYLREFKDKDNLALKMLDEILKTHDPNCIESMILKGRFLEKAQKYIDAEITFEEAIAAAQKQGKNLTANMFYYLGTSQESQKKYKPCANNYKKAITIDKNHFASTIKFAILLSNIGEGERATKYYKHALKIDPNSIQAHFGLGKCLQQFSENKDESLKHFQIVLTQDPSHYRCWTQKGILHLDREEFNESAECLKKAIQINKKFPLALLSLGNLCFETGNQERAITYHQLALKQNPKELQALIGLGNAYYDNGKPEEAVSHYQQALEIQSDLSDVHYNLGNALYLLNKIQEAIHHYKQAIATNPKKAESYYNLGNALCVKSMYAEAINAYNQAIQIEPHNPPALYNLGNAFYMLGQYQQAIQSYQKALQLHEETPECHFNLASAYNDQGDLENAMKHYKRAIELDDNNIDAFFCLGQVLELMKDFEAAENIYQQVGNKPGAQARATEMLAALKDKSK